MQVPADLDLVRRARGVVEREKQDCSHRWGVSQRLGDGPEAQGGIQLRLTAAPTPDALQRLLERRDRTPRMGSEPPYDVVPPVEIEECHQVVLAPGTQEQPRCPQELIHETTL
jgi:hypothetical protein